MTFALCILAGILGGFLALCILAAAAFCYGGSRCQEANDEINFDPQEADSLFL